MYTTFLTDLGIDVADEGELDERFQDKPKGFRGDIIDGDLAKELFDASKAEV